MGKNMHHPSPAHSPHTSNELGLLQNTAYDTKKWSSLVSNRRANSPSIADSIKNWRPTTFNCSCKLSIRPVLTSDRPVEHGGIDIPTVVHYAHQYGDFAKAHEDFDAVKEHWTPSMFAVVLKLITDSGCHSMEQSLRVFHQAIRNNGLWTHWIEASASFPKYEAMLLEELAAVIENLSPKYLKDIKIEHLLKIFPSSDGKHDVQLHGKKRKLKRQVLKWCETQTEEVLNAEWENINTLKWRLQSVIDHKDREMAERLHQKQCYQNNWRSPPTSGGASPTPNSIGGNSSSSSSSSNSSSSNMFISKQQQQQRTFSLADKNNWPSLQSHWNNAPHENRLVMGM